MKTIRQTATIRGATPHDIFETIMDSKKHTKLSRQPTTVSRRVGGAFKVGHDLEGTQLTLTKDKRIVQTWRANNWPERHVFEGHVRACSHHRRDPRHLHADRRARQVLRRDQQGLA